MGDPRDLTAGEVLLARELFKSSIDYARVKIHQGKYWRFQYDNTGMTPNGEIYIHGSPYSADYGVEGPEKKAFLIHEMTHVWQWQRNILHVRTSAILEAIKHRQDYVPDAYKYKLEESKDLIDFNIEQQAAIVEDYYRVVRRGLSFRDNRIQNQESLADKKSLLKRTMGNFINDPTYPVR